MQCFVQILQTAADRVAVACIVTMYGNTEATPAVHGCHGNFIFISGRIFIRENEYVKLKSM